MKVMHLVLREDPLDRWLLSVCKAWGIQCIPTGWQLSWAMAAASVCTTVYVLVCRDRGRWEVSRTCRVLKRNQHTRDQMQCRSSDTFISAETACNSRTKVERSKGGICEVRESKH